MSSSSSAVAAALRFWERGRKAVCVGRNYALDCVRSSRILERSIDKIPLVSSSGREHARELNNPLPTEPVLFLKPPTAYVREQGLPLRAPWFCSSLHHEVELGVVMGRAGSYISEAAAMEHVAGYALCLDMTARDKQDVCKSKGLPWTLAKAFDGSCPVSDFIPKERIPDPHDLHIWLEVNGHRRQDGHTSDMIFTIPFLINYISSIMTLEEGDLILTGTPPGVAAVQEGDQLVAGISNIVTMQFTVAARAPHP